MARFEELEGCCVEEVVVCCFVAGGLGYSDDVMPFGGCSWDLFGWMLGGCGGSEGCGGGCRWERVLLCYWGREGLVRHIEDCQKEGSYSDGHGDEVMKSVLL